MQPNIFRMNRRHFAQTAALAGAAMTVPWALAAASDASSPSRKIKLGLDNFAVRAMKWKADQLISYAASVKADSLFITDFAPFPSREDGPLRDLRKRAADEGMEIW